MRDSQNPRWLQQLNSAERIAERFMRDQENPAYGRAYRARKVPRATSAERTDLEHTMDRELKVRGWYAMTENRPRHPASVLNVEPVNGTVQPENHEPPQPLTAEEQARQERIVQFADMIEQRTLARRDLYRSMPSTPTWEETIGLSQGIGLLHR